MELSRQQNIILHANKEHTGVRFGVIFVLVIAFFVTFAGLNEILNGMDSTISGFSLVISCSLGLVIALGLAALSERFLKRAWPSGQRIELNEERAVAYPSGGLSVTVDWSNRFGVLTWYLSIKGYALGGRERRLPKNYSCLAVQLQQDEQRFVVNCYLPAKRISSIIEGKGFKEIHPAEYYKGGFISRWLGSTDRPAIPTGVMAGRDGPYWIAERRRWSEGLELEVDDFQIFLEMVERKFVDWDELGSN